MPTSLSGIAVHVHCGNSKKPLAEFSTELDSGDSSAISCWIESRANQTFSIRYRLYTRQSCGWSCNVYCDGVFMIASATPPKCKEFTHDKACNGDKLCSLMFSKVQQTDCQEAIGHSVNPALGTIQVKVWRIEPEWETSKTTLPGVTIDESPVHESKKLLRGHRVKLGKASPINVPIARPVPMDPTPYRVFTFHYRPIEMLRALGHVAPPISNISGSHVRHELPPRPQVSMNTQPRQLQAARAGVKRSASEIDEADSEGEKIEELQSKVIELQQEQARLVERRAAKRMKQEQQEHKLFKPKVGDPSFKQEKPDILVKEKPAIVVKREEVIIDLTMD